MAKQFSPATYEHAWPTAIWVAELRAKDAKSENPEIGKNINAPPDHAAAALIEGIMPEENPFDLGCSIVGRTKHFDERILNFEKETLSSENSDKCQVVLLAVGLDARAWRLPLSEKTTVFEVDVPSCMEHKDKVFKSGKIDEAFSKNDNTDKTLVKDAENSSTNIPSKATRVPIRADLATDDWQKALADSGFEKGKPSCFLIEGLVMYMPPESIEGFFKKISSLTCSKTSVVLGDTQYGTSPLNPEPWFSKMDPYNTHWTYKPEKWEMFNEMLGKCGFAVYEENNTDFSCAGDYMVWSARKE